MSGGRIINEAEARRLVETETGISFQRGALVHYCHDELVAAGSFIGQYFVLFGTLCINGYDPTNCFIDFQCANKTTLSIAPALNLSPVNNGNLHHNIIVDGISTLSDCHTTFWGYLFERQKEWIAQSPIITLGTGWSLASGTYSHTSGTTELSVSGAFLSGTPQLRLTITFTGITAGSVVLSIDNSGNFGTITEDGTYTYEITPDGLDSAIYLTPTNTFNGSFAASSLIIEKYDYI